MFLNIGCESNLFAVLGINGICLFNFGQPKTTRPCNDLHRETKTLSKEKYLLTKNIKR